MKITALECQKCKSIIYSRTTHDFRWCFCGKCAIDGGFEYSKISFECEYKLISIYLPVSKKDLLKDYIKGNNRYGLIIPEERDGVIIEY